jgi:hypothetical protein
MPDQTLDALRAKIQRNFPNQGESRSETPGLTWQRETANSLISACNRFRVSRIVENSTIRYAASHVATPERAARQIGVLFDTPTQAKDACEFLR